MKQVLVINGSPSKTGNVARFAKSIVVEFKKNNVSVKLIHLYDYKIIPHSGKLNPKKYIENTPDDMPMLQQMMLNCDGFVLATPTHWFSSSSMMKLFVDRLTSLEDYAFLLEGKVGGVITYGPEGGALNNAMLLLMILNQSGIVVPPYGCLFSEGEARKWVKDDIKLLAKNMSQMIAVRNNFNWGYPNSKYKSSPIENL